MAQSEPHIGRRLTCYARSFPSPKPDRIWLTYHQEYTPVEKCLLSAKVTIEAHVVLEARVGGGVMMALLIFVAIIGVGLGLFFTVPILIPATLTVAAVAVVRGQINHHAWSTHLFAAFGAAASLQIGFLLGGILRAQLSIRRNEKVSNDVSKNSTLNYRTHSLSRLWIE